MKPIRVVPIGAARRELLDAVSVALAREFRTACTVADRAVDPLFAHHPERNQYYSSALIEHLSRMNGGSEVLLGLTELDLYIPILTFVFGEAQLGGLCAVVSTHRLTQEFYGLPGDAAVLRERLLKEAIHEVGHTAGLTHCEDYECVMASAHSVEWLDLKGGAICPSCRRRAGI
jgi:archaemetzincin